MNIVCATDNRFVQHCSIMLSSLLVHNKDVHIYILTEGLTEDNIRIIHEEVRRLHGDLHFCYVDNSIVETFPMPTGGSLSHISRATYYRLLIADLLPKEVHKVIYLDCDMIVDANIEELWNFDLGDMALGAVLQIGSGFEAERLGYLVQYGYFNAGMNLINLNYFRDNDVSSMLTKYLDKSYSKIIYHDQDALNAVLYDKTVHLMPTWNMMSFFYSFQLYKRCDHSNGVIINNYEEEKNDVKMNMYTPNIIHYSAKPKPWQKGCTHPLANRYFDYAKMTLHFNDITPPSPISRHTSIMKHFFKERFSAIKQIFVKTDRTRY